MSFSQFISILRARWRLSLLVLTVTVLATIVVSLNLPKRYTATASVVVEVKPDPISGAVYGGMMNPSIMATQADIITSDRVARQVAKSLKLAQNPEIVSQWRDSTKGKGSMDDWLAGLLKRQLEIQPSRESNVITINYQAADPIFAAAVANAFVQAYIDTTIDLRVEPARQYSGFFNQRAQAAREKLESSQTRLSEYQRERGIVGGDERLDIETQRLNELSSQLVLLQSLAAESSSRSAQAAKSADRMSEALTDPAVGSLKVELNRAEANLQDLNTRLGPNNPQVIQARASIAELRSRLETETRRAVGSATVNANVNAARVAEVKSALEAQRTKVLKMKESRDEMSVLQRDVDNAQQAYDAIVGRMNQSSLESQTQQSNVNVLSSAVPPLTQSSPRLGLNIALALVLGTMLAVASAIVRELMDRRVRGPEDLVAALGLPIVGVMPRPAFKGKAPSLMAQRVISGRLAGPGKKA
ncbi:chain length determinant protein EpsF [Ideonella oryzae]|uniref:Chain length determinant protein EpsF n=1 Tax=Ideonella oryzae TaxID=2937441 RepID=A0ABT1BRL0_9BURK|nr:chain length determinant protein EpsF [Ideonella oryzae]MCO5978875.1 chain length determinant protein EpsF [Ideonella oryzae]